MNAFFIKQFCIFVTCAMVTESSEAEGYFKRSYGDLNQDDDQNVGDGELITKIFQRLEFLEAREEKYEQNIAAMQSTIRGQNRRIASLERALKDLGAPKVKFDIQNLNHQYHDENITEGNGNVKNHNQVSRIGKSRERRQQVKACAFYASIYNHHLQQLGADQDIPFDKVYTNVGNAYHPNLGVFIAPQPGTYVFSTTIMDVNSHDSRYYFSVNGKAQGNLFIHGVNSYLSSSSRTAIFLLNAGDEVAVKNGHVNEGVYGYEYSSFSGFLVSFDDSAGVVVG